METDILWSIAGTLLLSAFFSGTEIAFVSANRLEIAMLREQGKLSGRILSFFLDHKAQFISTLLVGNTIALVLYGIYMAELLEPWLSSVLPPAIDGPIWILVFQTVLSTILVLATAEFLPKSIFLINPNAILAAIALPLLAIYWVLYFFVKLIVAISMLFIRKVLRQAYTEDNPVFSVADLRNYLRSLSDAPQTDELDVSTQILQNAVEFKNLRVRDCMIPRAEVVAVDKTDSIPELKEIFLETGFSKVMVYEDSIDHIIGYCHASLLFRKPDTIADILVPAPIVPETMAAKEVMVLLTAEHKSIALVVDEFGGTSGIVTVEDIVEEIFGEIDDETDQDDLTEKQIDYNTWLISARHEIDYLNETYDWKIPEGEYETLGGYLIYLQADLPEEGDVIEAGNCTFKVISKEDARLDLVEVHLPPSDND